MHKIKLDNGKYKFIESYTGLDGKRHRVSVTKNNQTRATEKQAYEELQEKINNKLNKETNYRNFGYYIDEFLKYKKPQITKNTLKIYISSFKILDRNIKINTISSFYLDNLFNDARSKYSANSLKTFKTVVNSLLIYIKEYYHKDFDLRVKFSYTKEDKAREKQKIKYIETNQVTTILNNIDVQIVKDFVTVQLHTGFRAGELLALTKEDVDFENKKISITKTKHIDGNITSPKTISSIRTIEVSSLVLNIIENNITSDKFIFNVSINYINMTLRKQNLSSHNFRHTHVALLIEAGIPIKVISERLGHSDTNTTLSIYTHVTENMKLNLLNKLEKLGTF